jgi:hypothetical protein
MQNAALGRVVPKTNRGGRNGSVRDVLSESGRGKRLLLALEHVLAQALSERLWQGSRRRLVVLLNRVYAVRQLEQLGFAKLIVH